MGPDPLVDVLLPVRNGARYIADSIRSIQQQSFGSWRLLVLDDGSADETASIVKDMAQVDPRLSLVRLPKAGLVTTLNMGLRLASAPFIARQDADDISLSSRLERQVLYLQNHPDCAAVSGGVYGIDQDGKRLDWEWSPTDPEHADPFRVPARAPYIVGCFLLARREALLSVNGYRHFFHCEDADLCWRLAETREIVSSREILGEYRIHRDSVSTLSIINARVQALLAQLAAVAARRRRAARGDLDIRPEVYERLERAATLEGMTEVFGDELDREEVHYVLCGGVMQLLEMSLFRPFQLELSDVRLAATAWDNLPPCTPRNHTELAVLLGRVVRMLRTTGHHSLAREIAPDGSSLLHHVKRSSQPRVE